MRTLLMLPVLLLLAAPASASTALHEIAVGDTITLPAARLTGPEAAAAGGRQLTLRRVDVYTQDARIEHVHNGVARLIGRSERLYFVSTGDHTGERLYLSVGKDGREVRGALFSLAGVTELRGRWVDGALHIDSARKAEPPGDAGFECGGAAAVPARHGSPFDALEARKLASRLAAKGVAQYQAVLAIDTDSELMSLKFGDSTSAANDYVADLVAGMNVLYERDLGVTLALGVVQLRTGTDPYASAIGSDLAAQLSEFGRYWRDNEAGVARAFAAQLSGKSSSEFQASGYAWILDEFNYCAETGTADADAAGHFSATRVFRFSGSTAAHDVTLVAHELGHNFGAAHTHCTDRDPVASGLQPIDQCYNAEPSCYAGTPSCPNEFPQHGNDGTLMSYCNFGGPNGAGCGAVVQEFHPVHEVQLGENVTANIGFGCFTASAGADLDLVFRNGFE